MRTPVKRRWSLLVATCLFASIQVFGVDADAHLAVQVVEKNGDCRIADRSVHCLEIPRLLRELGVSQEQPIKVTSQGGGEGAQQRVDRLIEAIREAGYRNVSVGGIGPAPERRIPQDL